MWNVIFKKDGRQGLGNSSKINFYPCRVKISNLWGIFYWKKSFDHMKKKTERVIAIWSYILNKIIR
jgi:hypothetical protein